MFASELLGFGVCRDEHVHNETRRHGVEILTPERTYRVMVRVRICAEIPHRDVAMRGPLDLEGPVVPA